jgi:hypothetical protein
LGERSVFFIPEIGLAKGRILRFFAKQEEYHSLDFLCFELRVGALEKCIDLVKGAFAGSEAGSGGFAENGVSHNSIMNSRDGAPVSDFFFVDFYGPVAVGARTVVSRDFKENFGRGKMTG